ncbi:MAG: hypothetical protein K9N11_05340 [Lentisphaeria bacterium]|nr:hypothetical protein [Candidatus Neomarinimicrobiota bacterium]MCF7842255.1 hypothetical protein [Lentisphaeria bacterium]
MKFSNNNRRQLLLTVFLFGTVLLAGLTGCGKKKADEAAAAEIPADVLILGTETGTTGDTLLVPLMLKTQDKVMGIQFDVVWDSSMITVGEPQLSLDNEHMSIRTRDKGDRKTVIIFSLQGTAMDLVSNEVLKFPVIVHTEKSGDTPLHLTQVIVAGQGAEQLDIGMQAGKVHLN